MAYYTIEGCTGNHVEYDEDGGEIETDCSYEVGNKFEIFLDHFMGVLMHSSNGMGALEVEESRATCVDCNEPIADGAHDHFKLPFADAYGADVEGTPSATSDSVWFKVDYGDGWKFDVRISESRD